MKNLALVALALAGAATGVANGSVYLTFADPPGGREVSYVAPNAGGDAFGILNAFAVVNLSIDLSEVTGNIGDVLMFNGADFNHTVNVGALTVASSLIMEAPLTNGSFSFYDTHGDLILSASYDSGATFIFEASGATTTSNPDANLTFTVGPALLAAMPAVLVDSNMTELLALDASFTLTAFLFEGNKKVVAMDNNGDGEPEKYFNTFQANSAFTGTALLVPAPGAIALAGLGVLTAARRRRNG
jgi:hypothetical protein